VASMIFEYKNAFHSFNRNVRLMMVYYAMNSLANGIAAVLLNLYFLKLGLDENFLGSMVFVQSLGLGLAVLPFGMLADRYPKHTLVKVSWFLMNLLFTGILVASDPRLLIAFQAVQTIGIAMAVGSELSYLTENVPPAARTHLFSFNMALFTGIPAVGMAVAGYLPKLFGTLTRTSPEGALSYRLSMFLALALFWLSGFAVLGLRKSPAMETQRARSFSLKFSRPGAVLGLSLNHCFVALAASMFVPFMNVIMNQKYRLPAQTIGWLFTIQSVAIAFGSLLVPKLARKRGKLAGAASLQMLTLPAYLLLALAPNAGFFAVGYILRGMLANIPYPLIDSYTMEAVDAGERGTVNATLNLGRSVMWAVGGKIGGTFLKQKLFSLPILLATGSYSIAIGVFLVMLRIPQLRDAGECVGVVPETAETADAEASEPVDPEGIP